MDNEFDNKNSKEEIVTPESGNTDASDAAADSETKKAEQSGEGNLDDRNLSDDFVIGQDFFIDSSDADSLADDENKKADAKKHKKTKTAGRSCLTSMIWMAAIFIVAISAAAGMLYLGTDYLGVSLAKDSTEIKEIVIAEGTSARQVAELLEENDIIKSPLFFRFYARRHGYDAKFQYGVYYFCKQNSYEDIAEALIKKGALADEVKVTIPEGKTVDDIAKLLEDAKVCTATEFKQAVNEATTAKYNFDFLADIKTATGGVHYRLEGYLFPDTYMFYATGNKEGAEQAIKKMLQNMDSKLTDELMARAKETDTSINDVLTMASIIELEASKADYADKQRVSAVFHNRLEKWDNPYLQSDPTTKYPYNSDKYDTYKSPGLAPGPYCSPSIDSIKAALYPDENCNAFYFVTDKDMKFYFNDTLSGHNKTIADLKRSGMWK